MLLWDDGGACAMYRLPASPTCVANVTMIQQLTDCLAAGASANVTVDLTIACDYNLTSKTINLENQGRYSIYR